MRLTLIPDLSREQDKSSLLRPTNIWLKSWTERLHGVVLEYVDRDIWKNVTWIDRWDDLRAPKSAPEHLSVGGWQQYQEGQIIFGILLWPAGESNILTHTRGYRLWWNENSSYLLISMV